MSLENPQWKFSCQKGMKNNFLAKAGLEPGTAAFPQQDVLPTEPWSKLKDLHSNLENETTTKIIKL